MGAVLNPPQGGFGEKLGGLPHGVEMAKFYGISLCGKVGTAVNETARKILRQRKESWERHLRRDVRQIFLATAGSFDLTAFCESILGRTIAALALPFAS